MVADSTVGKSPRDRVVCAEGEHTRCPGGGEGLDPPSALPSTAGYRYADRHRALSGRAVLEDSPSPVYGAALLMRFGSDPIQGSNPRSSAQITGRFREVIRPHEAAGFLLFCPACVHTARTG